MAEVQFLDGVQEIDRPLVGPVNEVTNGSPERYTFREAMDMIGNWQTKTLLRDHASTVIRDHLRIHGTRH